MIPHSIKCMFNTNVLRGYKRSAKHVIVGNRKIVFVSKEIQDSCSHLQVFYDFKEGYAMHLLLERVEGENTARFAMEHLVNVKSCYHPFSKCF